MERPKLLTEDQPSVAVPLGVMKPLERRNADGRGRRVGLRQPRLPVRVGHWRHQGEPSPEHLLALQDEERKDSIDEVLGGSGDRLLSIRKPNPC
jgi:hypothetical protein